MTTAVATISGVLQGDTLPGIMQMLHLSRHQGWIVLDGSRRGELHYQDGELVHATCGELTGERALGTLLGIEGTFQVFKGLPAQPPQLSLEGAHQSLLMHAMRILDEQQQAATEFLLDDDAGLNDPAPAQPIAGLDDAPALDAVPQFAVDWRTLQLGPDDMAALSAIDGRQTVQALAQQLGRPLYEVQILLTDFLHHGWVTFGAPQMPQAFWTDVRAQTTAVLGPASILLLRDAASALHLPPEQIPRALAPTFLKTLLGFTTPARRPDVRAALLTLQPRYPDALKELQ